MESTVIGSLWSQALLLLLSFILLHSFCESSAISTGQQQHLGGTQVLKSERIFGGWLVNTRKRKFNFFASVRLFGVHSCGGTVISPHHIVTAAHCFSSLSSSVFKLPTSIYKVYIAPNNSTSLENEYEISTILIHSDVKMDIAVIVLKKAINKNIFTGLKIEDVPKVSTKVRAFGMGSDKNVENTFAIAGSTFRLKSVLFKIKNGNDCNLDGNEMKSSICTGPLGDKQTGICTGDSGSPLVEVVGESFSLIGIADSIIGKCDSKGHVAIYTKAYPFRNALNSQEIEKGIEGNSNIWKIH